jgi:hypothetical protein
MSGSLERRYRRVLRLLPGWYRQQWEEDMVAAFMDSWLTGDPEADAYISRAAGPGRAEVASVVGLATRLYLGGAGAPRRYFARGQAARNAVLAVMLLHAAVSLEALAVLAWARRLAGWIPAPPPAIVAGTPAGVLPPPVWYAADFAWIAIFVTLVLGRYRIARVLAAAAIVPGLVWLLQGQFAGVLAASSAGPWAAWALLSLGPVLAIAAFHRDAPRPASRPWLLALPAMFLLVCVPLLAAQGTGNAAWLPDAAGLLCVLVTLACLAQAPRAWSRRRGGSGVWSLTLTLLAAVAATYRVISLAGYVHDPHLIGVGLAELLILAAGVALVARDAARAQAATAAPPAYPRPA